MTTKRAEPTNILIQDRSRLFRECCKTAIEVSSEIRVLGLFEDEQELKWVATNSHVEAILLEVGAVPWNLIDLVAELRLIQGRPTIIGLRESDHEPNPIKGINFINRSAPIQEMIAVLRGRPIEGRANGEANLHVEEREIFSLTQREYQVLLLIASGFTTIQIGKRLRLSPKTIESRRQTLFSKLGVQNQSHAVAVAARSGLLGGISLPRTSP